MKRQRLNKKELIRKKIELRHDKLSFIEKTNKDQENIVKNQSMKNKNSLRIFGNGSAKPINIKLLSNSDRTKVRTGEPVYINGIKMCVNVLHDEIEKNTTLSVGIPCYNGKDIAWLCMEGLCNQVNIDFDWEIIICEEIHNNQIGKDFFYKYINRLSNIGCKKITYIELSEWVNLPEKWKIIGQNLDSFNGAFVLQAIDCYPPSERLSITHKLINLNNHDWIDFNKGYFYSFNDDKLILYNSSVYEKIAKTNLHMSFKSKYAKYLESSNQKSGIDGLLLKTISKINPNIEIFTYKELLSDGIDTDGYNNISKRRINNYISIGFPFVNTDKTIEKIGLPNYVIEKIKKMRSSE